MNEAVRLMLERYACKTAANYENALKEIFQEIALLGLWRAKFFEKSAFYGGSALRILYGLDRFSEDLDFSLLKPEPRFSLAKYNAAVRDELQGFGFECHVETVQKTNQSPIQSAFIKAGTRIQMIKIGVPETIHARIHDNRVLKVKFEIDIDPPPSFQTEAKTLLQPIPFSVLTFQKPDLFAGKIHALICRTWKTRIKGRDWYDLVWYIGHEIPVRLSHLKARLVQSKMWKSPEPLDRQDLVRLLRQRIENLDVEKAKNEVLAFLKDPDSVKLWSRDFFREVASKIRTLP